MNRIELQQEGPYWIKEKLNEFWGEIEIIWTELICTFTADSETGMSTLYIDFNVKFKNYSFIFKIF